MPERRLGRLASARGPRRRHPPPRPVAASQVARRRRRRPPAATGRSPPRSRPRCRDRCARRPHGAGHGLRPGRRPRPAAAILHGGLDRPAARRGRGGGRRPRWRSSVQRAPPGGPGCTRRDSNQRPSSAAASTSGTPIPRSSAQRRPRSSACSRRRPLSVTARSRIRSASTPWTTPSRREIAQARMTALPRPGAACATRNGQDGAPCGQFRGAASARRARHARDRSPRAGPCAHSSGRTVAGAASTCSPWHRPSGAARAPGRARCVGRPAMLTGWTCPGSCSASSSAVLLVLLAGLAAAPCCAAGPHARRRGRPVRGRRPARLPGVPAGLAAPPPRLRAGPSSPPPGAARPGRAPAPLATGHASSSSTAWPSPHCSCSGWPPRSRPAPGRTAGAGTPSAPRAPDRRDGPADLRRRGPRAARGRRHGHLPGRRGHHRRRAVRARAWSSRRSTA